MSIWQFLAAVDGYIKANSQEKPGKLRGDEESELWEWLESRG